VYLASDWGTWLRETAILLDTDLRASGAGIGPRAITVVVEGLKDNDLHNISW
jgi:hypothetical protein